MGRRYLLPDEAEAALRSGSTIECFLGGFERDGFRGVRYLGLSLDGSAICARLYEAADLGNSNYLDVYGFGPLDPEVEYGEADQVEVFSSFGDCLSWMGARWPGSEGRLVNEGVLQDEYAGYLAARPA